MAQTRNSLPCHIGNMLEALLARMVGSPSVGVRAGAGAGALPNWTFEGNVPLVLFVMTPL